MNVKLTYAIFIALTCLAPDVFAAAAHPCIDSPLKILLKTTGGSGIPFKCHWMRNSKHVQAWCSNAAEIASHCPKVCGKCPSHGCSNSQGTFMIGKGGNKETTCSSLLGSSDKNKKKNCKKSAVASTCRATCELCDSDDTESNQPSISESSASPSAVPSFGPSLVPSAVPSNKPSLVPTNAPSVQLSNPPSRELSLVPSFDPSYSSPRPSTLMWSQLYNDLTGEASGDQFGYASAISADGSRLIAGAYGHSDETGQVRVYRDTGDNWEQVHAPLNGDANNDRFGYAVGISEDGKWIIVGIPDMSTWSNSKVKVFADNGSSAWVQAGQDLIGSGSVRAFGWSVGMSSTGSRVIIGDPYSNSLTGRVYVLDFNGSVWEDVHHDQTDLLTGTKWEYGVFGKAVGISANGMHIIIGIPNNNNMRGQTKVFKDTGSSWVQLGQDLNGSAATDHGFGDSVAIAGNGRSIVIGALDPDEEVKVFEYNSQGEWVHVHDRNFNGNGANDYLGSSVGISHDGTKIVMGSYENGDIANSSGQVQVFKDNGTAWVQVGEDINGEAPNDYFGSSTGITGDGSRIVASAYGSNSFTGKVQVFEK
mmetsp:Transcript_478/g.794  ORF Transcript_478/g.794 Transcript_478/m.794 type:complete len:590 (-) Transcript_478:84-1853(-)